MFYLCVQMTLNKTNGVDNGNSNANLQACLPTAQRRKEPFYNIDL